MLNQIEGIVLNTRDYGETHKIMTVFTKSAGKISAIGRGANKPKSKLASVSQRFIRADFLVYLTKGLSTIQQGQIMDSYRYIREDIIKTAYTSYLIELTEKVVEAGTDQHRLYHQLVLTMDYINSNEEYMVPMIMYELKLFETGGFAPVLDCCVNCSRQENIVSFSVQEGGFLCNTCMPIDPYAIKVPSAFIRLLPIFQQVGLERIGDISMKKENLELLRVILDQYYDRFGGFTLKSRRFLNQIDLLK